LYCESGCGEGIFLFNKIALRLARREPEHRESQYDRLEFAHRTHMYRKRCHGEFSRSAVHALV